MKSIIHRSQCACGKHMILHRRSISGPLSRPTNVQQQRRSLQYIQAAGGPDSAPNLNDGNGNGKVIDSLVRDSDLAFVSKLFVLSIVGGLVIKYGSLLISLPFEPNAAVALAVVLGTPALYSLYLLTQSFKQQ